MYLRSGESVALNGIDKINSRLKFLHRQNRFLTPPLRRLLCNALIQPLFDYACTAWFPNLSKKLRLRFQATQNKCIKFCLQLDKMYMICVNEFLVGSMFMIDTFNSLFLIFKFYNSELFCPVEILQLLWKELSWIERLQSWDIGHAKTWVPSFKNLPDKLSMPAALDGFNPFKILNIFSGDVSESWQIKSFDTALLS